MIWFNSSLFFLAVLVIWILSRLIRAVKYGKPDFSRELWVNFFFLFLCYLLYRTFEPFAFTLLKSQKMMNLVPIERSLQMIHNAWTYGNFFTKRQVIYLLVGNVAIFVPVGFMNAMLIEEMRRFPRMLAFGVLFSGSIEVMQLALAVRVFDVDDIILNVFGTLVGLVLFALLNLVEPLRGWFEKISLAARPNSKAYVILTGFAVLAAFLAVLFGQMMGWIT